ncbi:MAG: protein kinase [Planctomycetes bacterium]|nr:protein kinase [Planctomycetota bacterium]
MGMRKCPNCGTTVRVETVADRFDGLCPGCLYQAIVAPPAPAEGAAPLEGTDLGNYRVLGLVGSGGMGTVYRARQKGLERTVALKVLSGSGPGEVERFFREGRAAARLRHPNIVAVHEVSNDRGYYFLTMDLIDGGTLGEAIRRSLPPPRRSAEILRTVCRAVHYAHEQGIVHRDLKPSNILLDPRGEPLVMDFGLAKEISGGATLTTSGMIMGTPAYMAPEQALGTGAVGVRTDVYALGAVLYECLGGHPPFSGEGAIEVIGKVLSEDPPTLRHVRSGIDRDIETICLKAMEKDALRRYPTAAALADDLDRFLAGEPILARPPGLLYRWGKRLRRQPLAWGLAACLVATLTVGLGLWTNGFRRRRAAEKALLAERDREAETARRRTAADPFLHRAASKYRILSENRYRSDARGDWRDRRSREIEEAAARAVEIDPENAEAFRLRGLARMERTHRDDEAFAGAEADFTRALELRPSLISALYDRGRLYMYRFLDRVMWDNLIDNDALRSVREHGEWKDRSVADLERARSLGGEQDEQLLAEVAVAMSNLRLKEAVEKAQAAFPLMAQTSEMRLLLGASYLFAGMIDKALEQLDRVIADRPRHRYALLIRIFLHLAYNRDVAAALPDLDVLREDDPDDLFVLVGTGEAYRRLGRIKEARAQFEEVARRKNHPRVWVALGDVCLKDGDPQAAMAAFAKAVELAPASSEVYRKRAEALIQMKDYAAAERDYTAAIERQNPPKPSHYWRRGWIRVRLKNDEGALADFAEALRLQPDHPDALRSRGQLLLALRRWAEAVRDFDRYIPLRPADPHGFCGRGEARLRAGDFKGAVEDLEKAVALGGDDKGRHQRLLDEARRKRDGDR